MDGWERLRDLLHQLDSQFIFESDHSILHLYFPKSIRENACIWLIGNYLDLVEKEVLLFGKILTREKLNGWLAAKYSEGKFQAMPDLGFILGIHQTGIG